MTQKRNPDNSSQALAEALQKLNFHFENSPLAAIEWDSGFRVVRWSAQAEKLFGWKADEVRGKHPTEWRFIHDDDWEEVARVMARLTEGTDRRDVFLNRNYTRSGEVVHCEWYSSALLDKPGKLVSVLSLIDNVTERVQAEAERRQRQEEIEELNRRLRRAMAKTHDRIRNNLQFIASLVDMQILEDRETVSIQEFRRLRLHLHALAIIQKLLTQEARDDPEVNTISAQTVLEELIPLLHTLAAGRRLRFRAEDARLPVRQGASLAVLVNELISNAVQHGRGDIALTFAVNGGEACLEVADRGPGFPEDFQPRQAAHTGLHLAERLSTWDFQGHIAYDNAPGGGARVLVTFPLMEPV